MTTALHADLALGEIHRAHNWEYATAAAREGASGFVAGDVGKLARQTDENSLWMLISTAPTWARVSSGEGSASSSLEITVIKGTPGTIPAGRVVYVTGWDPGTGAVRVELARANSAATMPAVAMTREAATDAAPGRAVTIGPLIGVLDTAAWPVGTVLYVSAATAGLLATRPTGAAVVQVFGLVCLQASPGHVGIVRDMPAELPNLGPDREWFGDPSSQPVAKAFGDFAEKATPAAADLLLLEDSAASYAKRRVAVGSVHPAVQQAAADADSSTTSTSYVNKLTLNLGTIPAGTYRVGWYAEVHDSSISDDVFCRVQVDGSNTLAEPNLEPKDNTNWIPVSGFAYVALSAAAHSVTIDYRTESAATTAYIRRARLEVVRV